MKKIQVNDNTQFAVLGLGKFGRAMASSLHDNGYNVLCCDINPVVVQDMADIATHIVQADATDKEVLEKLGISNFDVVVIAFNDFEDAAVTATIVKEMGVPFVMVKANGLRQKHILESIGVDRVVLPEREMGERIAYSLMTNDLMDALHRSDRYDILEMKPRPEWVNKSLQELQLRQTDGISVIALIRDSRLMAMLKAETVLLENDDLIVLQTRD